MIRFLFIFLLAVASHNGFASHIKGGYFTYEYKGAGINDPSALRYDITLTVYMACNPTVAQVDGSVNFSFFNSSTNNFLFNKSVGINQRFEISKIYDEPCITGNQIACYYTIIIYKLSDYELQPSPDGYTISFQRCCRINNMENVDNSGSIGNTWSIKIPGSSGQFGFQANSSPQFTINDTAVVCESSYFTFPFKATDPDGDSLAYSLCDAYQGGSIGGANPTTATNPPYWSVPYTGPFHGSQPMGSGVGINPVTGLISGTAPGITRGSGEYVVCVCIAEFRDGIQIGQTRKELHIRVGSCNVIAATLPAEYNSCDAFVQTFSNTSPSSDITSFWDFGVPSLSDDTSILDIPTFTYPDTGTFLLTLIVNKGQQCTDTSTSIVRVYPGFNAGFTSQGTCFNTPISFTDTTYTRYGVVDRWEWDFGDPSTLDDRSFLQNPVYVYPGPGVYTVTLNVGNSKGCRKLVTKQFIIIDNPEISLLFDSSANCGQDTLELGASANVLCNYTWTPNVNIINANSATPQVYPVVPTTYYVKADAGGCSSRDSVFINVIPFVSLEAGPDTTICKTDPVRIMTVSDGIYYTWTPSESLDNSIIKRPIARPDTTTTYLVEARVGKCLANDQFKITVFPYPNGNAGPDTALCFAASIQLNASGGNVYSWQPVFNLTDPQIANPVANPSKTILYSVSVRDTLSGCKKPTIDSILITILPKVRADAGPRDTVVVVNQPLQLQASGGLTYSWSPASGLSNPAIMNPVAKLFDNKRYILTAFDQAKCSSTDTIDIIVFKVDPDLFVPTAFSPNADGHNDYFRPIPVGMKSLNYFRVYDRWGKLMFSSSEKGVGWNGKLAGKEQDPGTFVWVAEGTDYLNRKITKKGYVILLR